MISCHRVTLEERNRLDIVRELFLEYEQFLGAGHVCVANFSHELDTLPGEYASPGGVLLLAGEDDDTPAGCLGLRTITTADGKTTAELKRMWVLPSFRQRGVGQLLIDCALEAARESGLKTIHLDTVPSVMPAAVKLYRRNGFVECARYNSNLASNASFFCRDL